jgi:hypothetical protein
MVPPGICSTIPDKTITRGGRRWWSSEAARRTEECTTRLWYHEEAFVCAFHHSLEDGVPCIFTIQANQNISGTQEKLQKKRLRF